MILDSGIKVSKPMVLVDYTVESICGVVQDEVGENEFSILFKGKWAEDGFIVEPDYYIPKQVVSSASVDYEEDISLKRKDGYVVVVHSHPFRGGSKFSGADEEYINGNFDCSLLYCRDGFSDARLLVKVSESYWVRLTPDVSVVYPTPVCKVEGLENISERRFPLLKSRGWKGKLTNDRDWWRDYYDM